MATQNDMQVLIDAGIQDTDMLVAAAAAFLRAHPVDVVGSVGNALTQEEEAFLLRSGAKGVRAKKANIARATAKNTAVIAGEYAQMVSTALSQKETASRLGVSVSRIRQRLDDGSLYALKTPGGRVCPLFQFNGGATLPGLGTVLNAISDGAHPVVVQRFFVQENADLVSAVADKALSPRDWLIAGHDVDAVMILASEL